VYFGEEDAYLLRLVEAKSRQERKSRSAVILSIVEEHFEKGHLLGEILVDLGVLSAEDVARALDLQRSSLTEKLLGEVLADEHGVSEQQIERALEIQRRFTGAVTTAK
jgi:transcriptional regulator GlxA family with amidase domain